jgi:3-phenylpropionate/trans-cinnamate dioxygenase ferredoxin subunit
MAEWIKVANVADVRPEEPCEAETEIDRQVVGVFLVDGQYFVLGECPHEGGPLARGFIERGDTVVCPWHSARFCIRTGEVLEPPAEQPPTHYEVKVENGSIYARRAEQG